MERKNEDIILNIDSETGTVSLNNTNLERVTSLDIHIEAGKATKVIINMDSDGEKIKALIKGEIQWFENVSCKEESLQLIHMI